MKRRKFLASMASVSLVPSANGNPYRDPEYVSLLSGKIRESYYGSGGFSALQDATRHLRRVQSVITNSKDTRLLSAASSLARQVSLVHYDIKDLPQAQEAGKLAAVFAERAGDSDGQASALNELSVFYLYDKDGQRGQYYARRALTVPDISIERESQAHANLGGALGILNEKKNASTHLNRAQEIGVELPDFRRAIVVGDVGVSHYHQGNWKAAQSTLGEAVKLLDSTSPLLGANYLARQVLVALRTNQPLLAAELMGTLGRIAPMVSSARLDGYLAEIFALSHSPAPWRDGREIKTMRQQLRTLLM